MPHDPSEDRTEGGVSERYAATTGSEGGFEMAIRLNGIARLAAIVLVACLAMGFVIAPGLVEKRHNIRFADPPYRVSSALAEVHETLLVADLHSDALLWDRDLTRRSERGHVDIPRLIEGNVAVQLFSVVTKIPKGRNIERNDDASDQITKLAVVQLWPPRTWGSLKQRALHQARKLKRFAEQSNGQLTIVKTGGDLHRYLERRSREPQITAGILGLEGAQALERDLGNLEELFEAGFRTIGLVHFFDNEVGGSAHGVLKGGLTELGRQVVVRMERLGILVDLAHASPALIDDVLEMAQKPVVVSHTGVKGTCDTERNLPDDHLRRVAQTGGVIGIGYWPDAVCGEDVEVIVRAIRYTADLVGVDHVGLGSDYDGSTEVSFDASGMALLTAGLLDDGFTANEIRQIMGGNVLRVLAEVLPDDPPEVRR